MKTNTNVEDKCNLITLVKHSTGKNVAKAVITARTWFSIKRRKPLLKQSKSSIMFTNLQALTKIWLLKTNYLKYWEAIRYHLVCAEGRPLMN